MSVDTQKYVEFVKKPPVLLVWITLFCLLDFSELEANECNVTQLMTAAFGLSAEAGEFTEVVKKIVFQGKPYNEEMHST